MPVAALTSELRTALAVDPDIDGDRRLIALLDSLAFPNPQRAATNLRLLAYIFPPSQLRTIFVAVLSTAVPDMALNNLERIGTTVSRDELLLVCADKGRLSQLLVICGSSPFLSGILFRDPIYFHHLFISRHVELKRDEEGMLDALRSLVSDATSFSDLFPLLRRFKMQEILRIAARDLAGIASLEEVTLELSALAAAALQIACEVSRRSLIKDHGIPLTDTPAGPREAELTVLGMGKLGGRELNFSSDIDIIFLYSSSEGETSGISDGSSVVKGRISLHGFFTKMAEMVAKAVSQITADGFVFRVDLGLRPEGKGGDVALSLRSAEIYYESWGQPWERAAMLKARPVAGSIPLGNSFLKLIEPFIYRKYLDYTLIEDIMGMKKKIDASLTREMEGEYNIKLGRGGIREIEFFIQALQIVYAGKNPALRSRNSLEALADLKSARLINDEDYSALCDAYRFLRMVEHRIQVVNERQTHSLPEKSDELLALARRCGFLRSDGLQRFQSLLEEHRSNVSQIYGNLFLSREDRLKEDVLPDIYFFFDPSANPDSIKDMLAERRFLRVDAAYDNLLTLRDGPLKVRMTERSRRLLERIAPVLLQEIISCPDPDMALANLDRFLNTAGSRSSIFALLAENRQTLKLLVTLFGISEFFSKILIAHPELLDSMVSRSSSVIFKARHVMAEELTSLLSQSDNFEDELDVLRRYRHEEFLRIGMNDIFGKLGQTEITTQLTWLADTCVTASYEMAKTQLSRFGQPVGNNLTSSGCEAFFAIIGMGKMGGYELNYHSDLDIIYVYDLQGMTNGERRITNHEYFAKLGQKIISILTTQTREGYVYKIDTRLRPSGNAGPLVTSLSSFINYHRTEAQIWERQALTKARVILGNEVLSDSINDIIRFAVYGTEQSTEIREEIHRMRMRMENEIAREGSGTFNIKTGRGGIVDIEFIVQFLQLQYGRTIPDIRSTNTLAALKATVAGGILPIEDALVLQHGYKFLRRLENRLRIINDCSMNDLGGSQSYLNKLARHMGYDSKLRNPGNDLINDYEKVTTGVRNIYRKVLCIDDDCPS
jgi:[glutamine synthetase] adenylyltransferase / [glutamine synthetase]-adenylyl-L-tyrosine phosphorylase